MGSNMAEAHPVGFQWVMEAKARGAKVVHIDPRFTRTSAVADQHVPLRAGSDIAFLGGVINYILSNELDFREYVTAYTNASFIVDEKFRGHRGSRRAVQRLRRRDRVLRSVDLALRVDKPVGDGASRSAPRRISTARAARRSKAPGDVPADPTLQHPRCVYQILKRHYARYTPEMVERICGVPAEQFLQIAKAWTENSGRERTAALVYSVGWTQHTVGAQYIRAGAIIQLLLGNIGRPGGGVHRAARAREHPGLDRRADAVQPAARLSRDARRRATPRCPTTSTASSSQNQKGFWRNADAYMISLLKEYWGESATAENDYCFDYMPRINGDHGTYRTVMDMVDGKVFGYFLLGQNPAVGSAHGRLQRLGMANLDWLVVRDLVEIESASFWKDGPEIETGEIAPETCRTEVFLFPAASHVEKAGTFTQTQRMLQWREKAVEPPGDARSELWFFYHLGRILRREAGRLDRRAGPAAARPVVGLRDGGRRAVGRGRAATDQRCGPDDGTRPSTTTCR